MTANKGIRAYVWAVKALLGGFQVSVPFNKGPKQAPGCPAAHAERGDTWHKVRCLYTWPPAAKNTRLGFAQEVSSDEKQITRLLYIQP